ncbi:MAG TPA: sensor histidine kinase [Thermomicrobiales bacterium]|nr:sensor histidine kinase [Thermomicrobiales bacterium]
MNDQWQRRLSEVPLLYKILLANGLIVVLGATVGTLVTAHTVSSPLDPLSYTLITMFAFVGFVLSIAVNYVVLRAAFQPLYRLGEVAESIRQGDFSRRVRPSTFSDPMLARLGASFNETLDELGQDRDRLRELTSQIIDAQEDERKRIARELHDDTAQVLFAQLLRLTALKSSEHEPVRACAEALEQSTVDAIEGVRRLALELRPPALDDLGLWAALAELAQRYEERYDLRVAYEWKGSRERLARDLELVLYRIAQEAMTNVVKHARASHVQLALSRSADEVALSISDDGVGFDAGRVSRRDDRSLGLGIFGMIERSALVGGSLRVVPLHPRGTRIEAIVPLALVERIMESATSGGKAKG